MILKISKLLSLLLAILTFFGFVAIAILTSFAALNPPSGIISAGPPTSVLLSNDGGRLVFYFFCIAVLCLALCAGFSFLFCKLHALDKAKSLLDQS